VKDDQAQLKQRGSFLNAKVLFQIGIYLLVLLLLVGACFYVMWISADYYFAEITNGKGTQLFGFRIGEVPD